MPLFGAALSEVQYRYLVPMKNIFSGYGQDFAADMSTESDEGLMVATILEKGLPERGTVEAFISN